VSVPIITWLKTGRTKSHAELPAAARRGQVEIHRCPDREERPGGLRAERLGRGPRLDPDEIPKAQLEALRASANGPRIIKTDPAPGTALATNGTIQRVVTLLVWDPNATRSICSGWRSRLSASRQRTRRRRAASCST
jgi:hypothetical protein